MEKKYGVWLIIFLTFILSIIFGYYIVTKVYKKNEQGIYDSTDEYELSPEEIKRKLEMAKVVNSTEEKIGMNTKVVLKTCYSLCGHEEENKIDSKNDLVNLKKEDLEKVYTGWNITSFSEEEVDLERDINGICGEHYIVKEENGMIVVYREVMKENSGNIDKEIVMTTDICVEYLPEEDIKNLEDGEKIYGKEAVNKFLEDYE